MALKYNNIIISSIIKTTPLIFYGIPPKVEG